MAGFDDSPWSSPEADLSPEQFCSVCLIDENTGKGPKKKELCKLPVRSKPGAAINKNAVHAASGAHGIQGVKGSSAESKRSAAKRLVSMYSAMGEQAPESVYRIAGMKMPMSKK